MVESDRHPWRRGLVLGLCHGVLFGLAFPPFGLWFAGMLAVVPMLVAAARGGGARTAVGFGLGTAPMWAFHHQYTWAMTEAAFVPLSLYLAIFPGLFVWMLGSVHRRWPRLPLVVAAPVLWTGLEVLRGEVVWDGYAQYLIGHPFIDRVVAWGAAWIGVYGVGFAVVAAVAGLFPERWTRADAVPRIRTVAVKSFGVVLALSCVVGRGEPVPGAAGEVVRVAAIQTNVPQDNRASRSIDERLRDFREMCDLTRSAAEGESRPDVIVWPEAMFPGLALNAEAVSIEREAGLAYAGGVRTTVFFDALIALQEEIGIPMLVGGEAVEGLRIGTTAGRGVEVKQDAIYNSAFMVRGGVVEKSRYDKMQLMPFGEVMPYISRWDWLERQLLALGGRGLTFDLEAGKDATIFEVDVAGRRVRIAAPICFEAVFARQMRRLIQSGGVRRAEVFVNMSNDGWFAWYDGGRSNVVLQCRWRSLEFRTPMVRAVNTGISAAIDGEGRLLAVGPNSPPSGSPSRSAGVLMVEIDARPREMTIYARFGDVVGWGCFAFSIVLIGGSFRTRVDTLSGVAATPKDASS
ncbi:MAG: apolipoprotein N-acyltransferase [Phycisphaerae bacterium]|nr:apolipoprotein N-acyltransferase [Phycisphaerae bacterium]